MHRFEAVSGVRGELLWSRTDVVGWVARDGIAACKGVTMKKVIAFCGVEDIVCLETLEETLRGRSVRLLAGSDACRELTVGLIIWRWTLRCSLHIFMMTFMRLVPCKTRGCSTSAVELPERCGGAKGLANPNLRCTDPPWSFAMATFCRV